MSLESNTRKNSEAKSLTYQFINKKYSIVDNKTIDELKNIAVNLKQTVRVCMHSSSEDDLHNMIIVHHKDQYIRPHANIFNSKAYHHIDGEMLMVALDENRNEIFRTILNNQNRVVRIDKGIYLYLKILSDTVIFHEIAIGPYTQSTTKYPKWAPESSDEKSIQAFQKEIEWNEK